MFSTATLTDAPTAYKDGVTDALWHPAITLTFDREITDAEIAALLAGAVSIQQDDGRYLTVYTLDGRRIRHHPTSVTLPYMAEKDLPLPGVPITKVPRKQLHIFSHPLCHFLL